jgi:probable F420-dependent oxidoreductase
MPSRYRAPVPLPLAVLASGLHRTLGPDVRHYVELARVADALGFAQLTLPEHVVMSERTDRYPYGRFPSAPDEPWPDPLVVLAAAAAATERIRLGTGVLLTPLRPAALLAKQIATLDNLSGGRVDLGIGTGWQPEEYGASGVPWPGRWARVDDAMRACRLLWAGGPSSFSSPTVTFDRIWCAPLPAQERIPIWLGAPANDATAKRIAEYGDGWMPVGVLAPDDVVAARTVLGPTAGIRAGVRVRKDPGATAEDAAALETAGATVLSVSVAQGLGTMPEITGFLESVAAVLL